MDRDAGNHFSKSNLLCVSCGSECLRTGIVFVFVCAVGFFFFFLFFYGLGFGWNQSLTLGGSKWRIIRVGSPECRRVDRTGGSRRGREREEKME